jgi:urea transport system permease protein
MTRMLFALVAALVVSFAPAALRAQSLEDLLATHRDAIESGSRRAVGPAIEAIAGSGAPRAQAVLEAWLARDLRLGADGRFYIEEPGGFTDAATGDAVALDSALEEIRPNGGVRRLLGAALAPLQLQDPDPTRRAEALDSLARGAEAGQLAALRASIPSETDPALRSRKERLERLLTLRFAEDADDRVAAIRSFAGDVSVQARAALNPLLQTTIVVGDPPEGANVAGRLEVGEDLDEAAAWALLVEAGAAKPLIDSDTMRAALAAHVVDGRVGGVALDALDSAAARERAYAALAADGLVQPVATAAEVAATLEAARFHAVYDEPSEAVTDAARAALVSIEQRVGFLQAADLALDALSLGSIYFLAAIGLAITFGVMGVINMAHGEFIMMGAYTGYVVQQIVPDYTVSILIALPLAFAITFGAGVAMERLVIRWLYHRPLETLLATFGISIALQQIAKNVFGTQARPLTAPDWLSGAVVVNDIVQISQIRIAIFMLALIFLIVLLTVLKRTRLGLDIRAVTQNPMMASAMGIDPNRVNMLAFGLGSGIAGVAGVAIGLFAQVTSELGQAYIVQSFMTVVVGGVGNLWGALTGAAMIGVVQKGIEWLNPANTLAAQTWMIVFVILFIQVRPKGIVALRGRAAGD